MAKDELVLIAPRRDVHLEAVYDLTGKVFSQGHGYYQWLEHCRHYIGTSHYDWPGSTIGLMGGRAVTHWGVWDYQMRIGSARVRTGGIGAVSTDGTLRKMGLMARTVIGGLERMRQCGYDMTVLFGIWNFYHKFGYVRAWPEQNYYIDRRHFVFDKPLALHKATLSSREDFDEMYNRASSRLTGSAVRPTYRAKAGPDLLRYVWSDGRGRPRGYVVVRTSGKFAVVDFVGEPDDIIQAACKAAERHGSTDIHFPQLHYNSPLAVRLRRGSCRLEMSYAKSGGAMIRTLNLAAVLAKMCPELSRRLKASNLADWRGELTVSDARETVRLKINRSAVAPADARGGKSGGTSAAGSGKARHAIAGGEEIAQLLIGTEEPAEIVDAAGIRLRGDGRQLVHVLFPAQHPMLGSWDYF